MLRGNSSKIVRTDLHTRVGGHVKYGGISTYIVLILTLIISKAAAFNYEK
jgi:hypothetical protein